MNSVWVYDIETIKNCFTYTALDRETEEVVQFVIWKDINQLPELLEHLDSARGLIGFNNLDFDYPVLHYILNNREKFASLSSDEITRGIYKKAQETIAEEWSAVRDTYIKIPQLDLFRIWHFNNKARMTSLKKLEIAMRMDNVQDMPHNHFEDVEDYATVEEILNYNLNDVLATYDFYKISIPKIDLRKQLYQRYGLKAMNYPDSKIGEDLTLKLYCEATGKKIQQVRKLRTYRDTLKFSECIPNYIEHKTEEVAHLLEYIKGIEVKEIKGSFKHSFSFRQQPDFNFDLGTGGIHGCIKAGVYEEDKDHIIIDVDVASLYPSLAIVLGLYPEHLGREFLEVYENGLLKPRLEAKRNGDKVMNLGFKLALNSVYGKSNSEYSWLYDPLYTLKTTIGGQLSLIMLSEMLMTKVDNIQFLQINTDGLTAKVHKSQKDIFYEQCKLWEKKTNLILEYQQYSKMIIRDVNSYIAQSTNGKLKYKGAFRTYDILIRDEEYHKSFSQTIVPKAISDYFLKGIPVEDTIMSGDNIYDFCKTFNATHGWKCETVNFDTESGKYYNSESVQKTNRYYISTEGKVFRKLKPDKEGGTKIIEIEAGGKLVTLFNKRFDLPISKYKINYDYYINECYKIIHKIDGTEERIEQEKRREKEKEKRRKQEEKFVKYCIEKQPTERQYGLYVKQWLIDKYGKPTIRKTKRRV